MNTPRFIKQGDCYVDTKTGLEWRLEDEPGRLTWKEAMQSHKGWRLPTIEELIALVDFKLYRSATELPGVQPNWYWSSTTCCTSFPGLAWDVGFSVGYVGNDSKDYDGYVRLVRTGENPSGGCPYCHGDAEVAEIAIRMGFRPDVAFCRVRELEREIKAMEVCTLGKV